MSPEFSPQNPPATVGQALQYCHDLLEQSEVYYGHGTDNAWDEAVQLVLSVAQLPPDAGQSVLPKTINASRFEQIDRLLQQRIKEKVPLPYLLGRAWFAGLEFGCDSRAIIPRSPIAELILHDFTPWYRGPSVRRVLDLCCGGGCMGLATAHYHSHVVADLLDIDEDALSLARENTRSLGLGDRVRVLKSDIFEELIDERYDIILCNPPYVNARDLAAMPQEYCSEPELALGSGADGLDLARRILTAVGDYLQPTGLLIMEVGYSWPALEDAYPDVPFTWVEFSQGGEGVFALTAREWQDYRESFIQ